MPVRLSVRLPDTAALIVIDLQKAIDHPGWGERNNPDAEKNVGRLRQAWRAVDSDTLTVKN